MSSSRRAGAGFLACLLVLLIAAPPQLFSQETKAKQEPKAKPVFKPEEIEQLVAPVALHPDSLLSQILIASTYPLEVVQAERWAKKNEKLKGDALTAALEKEKWDPSVKSLVNFPQVLSMMSEKLDWTQKLGDAFLAQQKDVMDTIQKLRAKAQAEGNLKTTKEQKVEVQDNNVIVIVPADPQVVYVPTYNPTVVYGAWPYPAYPPYYYYPPYYAPGAAAFSFTMGVFIGAAWGYAWGGCNWHGSHVDIDVDRNTNINRNIDRGQAKRDMASRGQGGQGRGQWQHDASHRKGVAYRDQATAQKFDRGTGGDAAKSRDQYRGRDGQGGKDFDRGGAAQDRSRQGAGGRDSAFGGMDQGRSANQYSDRGRSSRDSMSASRGGGGGYGGGGGGRGGGGRGGGRR